MKFREWLNEVKQTGNSSRDEFPIEETYLRLSTNNLLKLLETKDSYSLYRYYDYLFLVKNNKYIAHLDGTIDKLFGKKSFYITSMYSNERGAMNILYELMKLNAFKYIVSDTMLSTDAVKHYKKLIQKYKYFGVDYKDEVQKVSDTELFNNPDYRIVISL